MVGFTNFLTGKNPKTKNWVASLGFDNSLAIYSTEERELCDFIILISRLYYFYGHDSFIEKIFFKSTEDIIILKCASNKCYAWQVSFLNFIYSASINAP